MELILAVVLPVAVFLVTLSLPLVLVTIWKKRRARLKRSPLVSNLLRSPGESLRNALDEITLEILTYCALTPAAVLIVFSMHLSQSYIGGQAETVARIVISVLMVLGFLVLGLNKLFRLIKQREKLQQGYEGELAVAQELNQLMLQGALVYHDVPAEGFNIDHVVVSQNGIYAVETKARMKPIRDMGKDDAKVIFDGSVLSFPTWKETEPLEQAARQAKWLEKWLSSAVGDTVSVRAALALPGWFVERTGRSEVAVFNPKNANFLAKGWLKDPLSESLIKRIAHQLDQQCRDVEPMLYGKKNGKLQ